MVELQCVWRMCVKLKQIVKNAGCVFTKDSRTSDKWRFEGVHS